MGSGEDSMVSSFQTAPSLAVVEAVAHAENVPVEELAPPAYPPLHEAIDPQALDQLVEPTSPTRQQNEVTVQFQYCGRQVTVDSTGEIALESLVD
ncbi:HalOD1 output domain-containing protein [Saliphagus sp. GCM10025308]